jgi:hypothetical protein
MVRPLRGKEWLATKQGSHCLHAQASENAGWLPADIIVLLQTDLPITIIVPENKGSCGLDFSLLPIC